MNSPERDMGAGRIGVLRVIGVAVAVIFASDIAIFRSGWYLRYLKPDSSFGLTEWRCRYVDDVEADGGKLVAVLGHSQMDEGFSTKIFDNSYPGGGVRSVNLSIPGSSLRVWYYLLRHIDPRADRFKAVVIPLRWYDDRETRRDYRNRILDIGFLGPLTGFSDLFGLVGSFGSWDSRGRVVISGLLKWHVYRQDLQDFLSDPSRRLRDVEFFYAFRRAIKYVYEGRPESLAGIRVEGRGFVNWPAHIDPAQRERLRKYVFGPAPVDRGEFVAYRRRWLDCIVEHYAGSGTLVVVARIPCSPVPSRLSLPPQQTVIDDLKSATHVRVVTENMFTDLMRPEFFFDPLHLNGKGRRLFSVRLSREIARILRVG